MTLVESVVAQWRDDGIAMDGPGVDAATLTEIERVHGVRLPAAFRELWSLCDGTCAPDRHALIYMQASDLVQPLYGPRDGNMVSLVFADWRLGTAVSLRLSPEDRGVVIIDSRTSEIAPSFDEFLEAVLGRGGHPFPGESRRVLPV
jgi:hypothetical protein